MSLSVNRISIPQVNQNNSRKVGFGYGEEPTFRTNPFLAPNECGHSKEIAKCGLEKRVAKLEKSDIDTDERVYNLERNAKRQSELNHMFVALLPHTEEEGLDSPREKGRSIAEQIDHFA